MTTLDLTLQNLSKTLLTMQEQVAQSFARQRRAMQEQGRPDYNHTTTETAKEVLRGYGRANEAALASLMDVQDWQRIARQELERRATSIVQALDDATLEAIAAGTLDMRAMCRQVSCEIDQIA